MPATKPKAPAEKPASKSAEPKSQLREPTEAERAAGGAAITSQSQRPTRAALRVARNDNGNVAISNPHADWKGWTAQISEAFGTTSSDYANEALARLINVVNGRAQPLTEGRANSVLALMSAIAPRDEQEAAIGEQIVATHFASMEFLRRAQLNAGEYRDTAVAYAGVATKLSRTMAVHVEALAKLRNGGKQQVIVKHVYVDARGSQNVIGSEIHSAGGGANLKALGQPHGPDAIASLAAAPSAPLWSEEPARVAVPETRDER